MKQILPQIVGFTAKLSIFYIFLLIFGLIIFYLFISPAYKLLVNTQTFTVDAVAKSDFTPDVATILTGASIDGNDAKDLTQKSNDYLTKAIDELKNSGIEEKDITSNYSIDPKYDKEYINIIGYRANIRLEVKTKDFDNIEKVLEIASNNNLNRVDGVYFSFEDPISIRESLREEAIKTAKQKAEKIANESGLVLGKLLNVYEGSYYPMYNDQYKVNAILESSPDSINTVESSDSFNPGQTEMEMQITLVYEVK